MPTKRRCQVTAILNDGTRDTVQCEASSKYNAVFTYVNLRLGNGHSSRPGKDTVFEITPEGGATYKTTLKDAWDWANRQR